MSNESVVIVGAARTPIGMFQHKNCQYIYVLSVTLPSNLHLY